MPFSAPLWRYPGPNGWFFVDVPAELALPVLGPFGRTPVRATVDGHTWATSVWREASGRVLLAVPKRVRGAKHEGDAVSVSITIDVSLRR